MINFFAGIKKLSNSLKEKMSSSGYRPISSSPVPVGWSASLEKTMDTLSKSWPEIALKVGKEGMM